MRLLSMRSISLLTVAALCTTACYAPSGQVRTTVKYRSDGVKKEPVRVGSRLDFEAKPGSEVVIVATETPLCAPVEGVTRTTTKTPILERRGSEDGVAVLLIGGGVVVGGNAILMNALFNKELDESKKKTHMLVGGALLTVGLTTVVSRVILSKRPHSKYGKPTASEANGAGISMEPQQWVTCGPARPLDVDFDVSLLVDKKKFTTQMRSGSDGRLVLSQAFLTAVGDAEALCGRPVSLTVNLTDNARQRYSTSSKVNSKTLFQSQRASTSAGKPIVKWDVPFKGNNWLEFGPGAGLPGSQFSDMSKIYNRNAHRSSFNVRATALKRPGVNKGPSITKNAVAYCASAWKTSCVQNTRGSFSKTCWTSCINEDAVETCELKHEICIEQTAGIGGTLAQQCDKQKSACVRGAGQDANSRNVCKEQCMTRQAEIACK